MKQFFTKFMTMAVLVMSALSLNAQQLPDPGFEDWNGGTYYDNDDKKDHPQLTNWHASNVDQAGFKFNFEHQEAGHSGK